MSTETILAHEEGELLLPDGNNKLYYDTKGIATIGHGYAIGIRGLPDDIVEELFRRDLAAIRVDAARLPEYAGLDPVRQGVLERMVFQMGITAVRGFTDTRAALARKDWQAAHDHMLQSKWHKDTPERCEREAQRILTGVE